MSDAERQSAETLAVLLSHIGRAGDAAHLQHGLTAAQWTALRYLADANAMSRTVSALARYCATTRGPASKTVKALIDAGYAVRRPAPHDGRSSRIDLTASGRELAARDPYRALVAAIGALPTDARTGLARAATRLLADLPCPDGNCFGTCPTCGNLVIESGSVRVCALNGSVLAPGDEDCICAAYTPRPRHRS